MKYSTKTLRGAGLEARWVRRRNGAPIIVARDPQARSECQRKTWWTVGKAMWVAMKEVGIREAFARHTLLGDAFSVQA